MQTSSDLSPKSKILWLIFVYSCAYSSPVTQLYRELLQLVHLSSSKRAQVCMNVPSRKEAVPVNTAPRSVLPRKPVPAKVTHQHSTTRQTGATARNRERTEQVERTEESEESIR